MLNILKEHLKFLSFEIQEAQSNLQHYIGGAAEDVPFADYAAKLDKLHNDYDVVIRQISDGTISTVDQALLAIEQLEKPYPKNWR